MVRESSNSAQLAALAAAEAAADAAAAATEFIAREAEKLGAGEVVLHTVVTEDGVDDVVQQ